MNRLCTKKLNFLFPFLKHVLQSYTCKVTRVSEKKEARLALIYTAVHSTLQLPSCGKVVTEELIVG